MVPKEQFPTLVLWAGAGLSLTLLWLCGQSDTGNSLWSACTCISHWLKLNRWLVHLIKSKGAEGFSPFKEAFSPVANRRWLSKCYSNNLFPFIPFDVQEQYYMLCWPEKLKQKKNDKKRADSLTVLFRRQSVLVRPICLVTLTPL